MRILFLGINFHPELTGIGKYTTEMAIFLVHQGHDVHVVTAPPYYPYWKVPKPYKAWTYTCEDWNGIRVYRCPLWVPRRVNSVSRIFHLVSFAFSTLPILLMQIAWRPQAVMVIAPAITAAPFGLLTARLSGAKAWLHLQDFELDAALNLGLLSIQDVGIRVLKKLERNLLSAFDAVSSVSEKMCAQLHKKGVPQEKIILLPNWVDTHFIHPLKRINNPYRQLLSLGRDEVVALYAGNMGKKQGLEIIIEAAEHLKFVQNLHFILAGDGISRKSLVALSHSLPNVHFLPLQPSETLNLLLNMADIHLLPQLADAADLVMPSKLTGMLASGRPVIATAIQDTEIARVLSQVGIVVTPENPTELAKAILDLAYDKKRRKRLGAAGRKYAFVNWDQERVLNGFSDQLGRIVEQEY